MGYYEYQKKWNVVIGEVLEAMEQTNGMDKYAVAFCKNGDIVGQFPKENTGIFAKLIFYFLNSEMLCTCKIKVAGKRTHFGDHNGLSIPCLL